VRRSRQTTVPSAGPVPLNELEDDAGLIIAIWKSPFHAGPVPALDYRDSPLSYVSYTFFFYIYLLRKLLGMI
jgi:hypothetical protein